MTMRVECSVCRNLWPAVFLCFFGCGGNDTKDGQVQSALTFPNDAEIVSLITDNGKFFMSSAGGPPGSSGQGVYANRTEANAWEKFLLVPSTYNANGYEIMCQGDYSSDQSSGLSIDRRYYMTAINGGGGSVYCNRTAVGPWETFFPLYYGANSYGDNYVALKTYNGHYLRAQNGGGYGVDAASAQVGYDRSGNSWELWLVVNNPSNSGIDTCPGAIGGNCDGVPGYGCTDETGRACNWLSNACTCSVSIGSELHDSCCSSHPDGYNCGGPNAPTTAFDDCGADGRYGACADEWNRACNDWLHMNSWPVTFYPDATGNAKSVQRPYVAAYFRRDPNSGALNAYPSNEWDPVDNVWLTMWAPSGFVLDCGDAERGWCTGSYSAYETTQNLCRCK
jgi:hypothetical protein